MILGFFGLGLARGCGLLESRLALNPLAKILLYLTVVVLLAAVLSPPFYWGLHGVLDYPFHRYFSRVAQVSAIVLLIPLLFWLKIRGVGEFGLRKNPHPKKDLSVGVGVALVPVLLLGMGYFMMDVYKVRPELDGVKVLRIFGTAAVVSVVEEFLFRGVLLGLTVRIFGRWSAAVAVSLVFAVVHFLKPSSQATETVEWWTGFAQIPSVVTSLPPPLVLGFGLASLFLVGMILAMAALRTGSLWLPIGLHAGWILGQQGVQWFGKFRVKPPEALLPWVGPNVVSGAVPTGLVPLAVLILTGIVVWGYIRYGVERPSRA